MIMFLHHSLQASLGFSVKPNSHKKRRAPVKSPKPSDFQRRKLPARSGKATFDSSSETAAERRTRLAKKQNKKKKLFKGNHDDECYICDNGGNLVCCDYCSKAFHLNCHIPPLKRVPHGEWTCCECKATGE